jgi:hypothetical protein
MATDTAELRYHDEDPGWRLTVTGNPANPLHGFGGNPEDPEPYLASVEDFLATFAGYRIVGAWMVGRGYASVKVTREGPRPVDGVGYQER